jgi:hemerythrin superfamily protein
VSTTNSFCHNNLSLCENQITDTKSDKMASTSTYPDPAAASSVDVIEHVMMRHREIEMELRLLEELDDVSRRSEILNQLVHDLAVHTAVEELILYPTVKHELGEIDPKRFSAGVLEKLEEHHAVKTVLDELYSMGPSNERFKPRARFLAESVRAHVKEEEENFLPELRKYWTRERLVELGERFIQAEKAAPTRPHPMMPDQGRFLATTQHVAAAFDKLKDTTRDAMPGSKTSTRERS